MWHVECPRLYHEDDEDVEQESDRILHDDEMLWGELGNYRNGGCSVCKVSYSSTSDVKHTQQT